VTKDPGVLDNVGSDIVTGPASFDFDPGFVGKLSENGLVVSLVGGLSVGSTAGGSI